jgi:nucleoside-diphosphate-sugar epimerase
MNRLLLTGATGFLGGTILSRLISTADWPSVLLLVRAADPVEGRTRILNVLRTFEVPQSLFHKVETRQIICGSLTNVAEFSDDPRLADVTHVINSAALASFANHPQIWPVNVNGTLDFARVLLSRGRLHRFLHVGTGMACGMQAPSPVREDYQPGADAEHLVEYTASKLACERRLRDELPDLPLVVARPSIIVGHTRLGCKPSPSIFWVFRFGTTLRRFTCGAEQKIDVVPVDYCADAILSLLRKPTLSHDHYHIAAGPHRSSTFGELDCALAHSMCDHPPKPYLRVDYKTLAGMQDRFDTLFGTGNKRVLLRAIRLYGVFAALGITFHNDRLLAEGIPLPPAFADYIGMCAETTQNLSIYEQMKYDFKGAEASVVAQTQEPLQMQLQYSVSSVVPAI